MGVFVVTGAASGIGQAIQNQLQQEGHEVIGVDLQGSDINADLSDENQLQGVIEAIQARAPDGLSGFVPCAGVGPETQRRDLIPQVNYFAPVAMVNALLPELEKCGGSIVLICSNSATLIPYDENYIQALLGDEKDKAQSLADTLEGQQLYGGGKLALGRWMRKNTPAMARKGIRVNAIAPGFTETGMTSAGLEDPEYAQAINQFRESIPLGRGAKPEDQANAALFLLSDKASFITGVVLFVDGGHDAMFRPDMF